MKHIGQVKILGFLEIDSEYLVTVEKDDELQLHRGDILEGDNPPQRWAIGVFALVRWLDPSYILTRQSFTVLPLTDKTAPPENMIVQVYRPEKENRET